MRGVTADELRIKIFADGADLAGMLDAVPRTRASSGFTTNPTLMRKAGIDRLRGVRARGARDVPDRPISFEVFSDESGEMGRQAREDRRAGASNVYVKIPVTNTRGEPTDAAGPRLSREGVKLNVTGADDARQVAASRRACAGGAAVVHLGLRRAHRRHRARPAADDGARRSSVMRRHPTLELIWASPREVLNIVQADEIGCHIITVTHDLLEKLPLARARTSTSSRSTP